MRLYLTKKDYALVVIFVIILLATAAIGRSLPRENALMIFLIISLTAIMVVLLEMHRRLSAEINSQGNKRNQDYKQIEALFSLFNILKPGFPLPAMREWAASPDLLIKITELILIEKPELVVETGSGVSTLVIAYCLKRLGRGKVVSLEHDATYALNSQNLINYHGLSDVAKIVYAPLTDVEIKSKQWRWYSADSYIGNIDRPIDLLFIDGPPADTQEIARYPALTLLYKYFNDKTTIVMDDGNREDEKKAVVLWEKELGDLSSEFLDLEKGAYLLNLKKQAIQ